MILTWQPLWTKWMPLLYTTTFPNLWKLLPAVTTHFIRTQMKHHYYWGIGIGIRGIRSPKPALGCLLISLGIQDTAQKMYEKRTGQRLIKSSETVVLEVIKPRQIANGWIMIADGRRLPFGYASPSIVVLGTLAQRSILLRTFITIPWWRSFSKMYQIPPITDFSIMNLTNFAGSHLIRPKMYGFMVNFTAPKAFWLHTINFRICHLRVDVPCPIKLLGLCCGQMPLISPPLAQPNYGPYTSIWAMN